MRMTEPTRPGVRALLNMQSIIIGAALLLLMIAAGLHFVGYIRGDAPNTAIAATATGGTERTVVVDVKGAVLSPGLYRLPQGSRVEDALQQAGLTADAAPELLNRAAPLSDGSELIVPVKNGAIDWNALIGQRGGAYYSFTGAGGGSLTNINTAGADELQQLPGIGEVNAAAIVAYREANGPFVTKEQIMNVTGIGEATFAKIEEQICVE